MNKPAPKEPSMDEILSSIRQIIADDDATAPRRAAGLGATRYSSQHATDEPIDDVAEEEPLALSAAQILAQPVPEEPTPSEFEALLADTEGEDADDASAPYVSAQFIDPEDVSFDAEPVEPVAEPPVLAVPVTSPPAPARPRPTAAEAAPMPDPTLSHDIAEELLEPTAQAAVRANFAKLNRVGLGTPGITIEAMMRDMLKPMLKEWLDENLPAVVERMVEKEIGRISRGVE